MACVDRHYNVYLHRAWDGELLAVFREETSPLFHTLKFSPDEELLVYGLDDGSVIIRLIRRFVSLKSRGTFNPHHKRLEKSGGDSSTRRADAAGDGETRTSGSGASRTGSTTSPAETERPHGAKEEREPGNASEVGSETGHGAHNIIRMYHYCARNGWAKPQYRRPVGSDQMGNYTARGRSDRVIPTMTAIVVRSEGLASRAGWLWWVGGVCANPCLTCSSCCGGPGRVFRVGRPFQNIIKLLYT